MRTQCFLCLIFLSFTARAEIGVTNTQIRFGMVTSMTGPVGSTGEQIRDGYRAAFERANRTGGVSGRKFRLNIHDDGYDPARTSREAGLVVRGKDSFALVGTNGTSTIATALPLILNDGIPLLFPRSGMPSLRAFHGSVFNLRPSFVDEMESLIQYSLENGRTRIAIFFQTDAFGDALRGAALRIIEDFKAHRSDVPVLVSVSGIDRETVESRYIEANFARIEKGEPQTVILATSLAASAPFIRLANVRQKPWLFLSVSSTVNLTERIGDLDPDLVFSQVVPNPFDRSEKSIVAAYQEDLQKIGVNEFDYTSLESYINGRILIEAVRRSGPAITRESFIDELEHHPYSLGGLTFDWSSTDHNAHGAVYLSRYRNGHFVPIRLRSPKVRE